MEIGGEVSTSGAINRVSSLGVTSGSLMRSRLMQTLHPRPATEICLWKSVRVASHRMITLVTQIASTRKVERSWARSSVMRLFSVPVLQRAQTVSLLEHAKVIDQANRFSSNQLYFLAHSLSWRWWFTDLASIAARNLVIFGSYLSYQG